jgi:hypothetical protein
LVLFPSYDRLGVLVDVKIRNPTIEEQALARIHRIGQKKEVTTIRFFVKDTFEEVSSLIRSNGIRARG